MGLFIGIKKTMQGYALLLEDTSIFRLISKQSRGVNLHVYLTNAVDPRDVTFPDKTAIDTGEIQSAYGAQQYTLRAIENQRVTALLYYGTLFLKRSYSFSQLSKQAGLEQAPVKRSHDQAAACYA